MRMALRRDRGAISRLDLEAGRRFRDLRSDVQGGPSDGAGHVAKRIADRVAENDSQRPA